MLKKIVIIIEFILESFKNKIHDTAIIHPDCLIGKNVKIFENTSVGFIPICVKVTKRKIQKTFEKTEIGDNTIIYPNTIIYANVKIGKNCLICSGVVIREGCIIGDNCIIANGVTLNYNVKMGNHVKVMDNSHITGNMIIEDDVFISTLVATVNDNTLGRNKGDIEYKAPMIKKGASIGANATLLPNIIIGAYAIVGSGSVVTKNVKPYTLVMGVPAKIKRRVTK